MTPTPPPAARTNRRRLLVAGAIAVAAVLAFVAFLLPGIRRDAQLDALSDSLDVNFKALAASDDPGIQDALVARMEDASKPFGNRVGAATVLLHRNRGSLVERALRTGSLDQRTVALAALRRHNSFGKQVAVDQAEHVKRTLVEWLGRSGDRTRKIALEVASRLRPPEALPSIRALVAAPGEPSDVRRMAIVALHMYADCEAVPDLHRLAKADADPAVRKAALQALDGLHGTRGAPCKAVLTDEMMKEAVAAALAHPGEQEADRLLRQYAMMAIRKDRDLAAGQVDVLRARLAPGPAVAERREALETLASVGDERTIADLARYVHDAEDGMRHSAAIAVARIREPDKFKPHAMLLVGYVRDERSKSGEAAFSAALERLRADANRWVGFPDRGPETERKGRPSERELVKELYAKGEGQGVTRAQVADALFRHHAGQAGLDAKGMEAAVALRESFWAKARANDVAGARALLEADAVAKSHPAVFLYERGWLDARG